MIALLVKTMMTFVMDLMLPTTCSAIQMEVASRNLAATTLFILATFISFLIQVAVMEGECLLRYVSH